MKLCEISVEKLHKAANKAREIADKYRAAGSAHPSMLKGAILKRHAEMAYDAQAARFINAANRRQGKAYKDLSHEAIHAQNPRLAASMREHRRARTQNNQTDRMLHRMRRREMWAKLGVLSLWGARAAHAFIKNRRAASQTAKNIRNLKHAALGGGALLTGAAIIKHRNKHRESCLIGLSNLCESSGFIFVIGKKR